MQVAVRAFAVSPSVRSFVARAKLLLRMSSELRSLRALFPSITLSVLNSRVLDSECSPFDLLVERPARARIQSPSKRIVPGFENEARFFRDWLIGCLGAGHSAGREILSQVNKPF